MTVIALLNHPATPILLSDMLLSTDGGGSNIFLPALGDLNLLQSRFSMALPFKATRMARKPFLIGDHTLVAWAGNVSTCRQFKQLLNASCANRPVTQEDVDTVFWQMNDSETKSFSVICVGLPNDMNWKNWRQSVLVSHRNCIEFTSKLYGKCLFGGSGAETLSRFIQSRDDLHAQAHSAVIEDDKFAIAGASVAGHLMFNETLLYTQEDVVEKIKSGQLLEDGCGGFYETYTFTNRAFVAPRPILHLHIRVDEDSSAAITRAYHASGRDMMAVIVSLVAEGVTIPNNGEVHLGDAPVDLVICKAFDQTKDHLHCRSAPSILFSPDFKFSIDEIAVTLFRSSAPLPDEILQALPLSEQVDAETMNKFQLKQSAFRNPPELPLVTLQFSSKDGFTLRLNPQWVRGILERFTKQPKPGLWHMDWTRA